MNKVAIILPAYNEEITIIQTIQDFHREMPEAEIWVINNRSDDRTEELAKLTIAKLGCSGGLISENRVGKASAIRNAFLSIEADFYIIADSDCTYPANQVKAILAPLLNGEADMVIGNRHISEKYALENKRKFHVFGNKLLCFLINKLFNANLNDIASGYRGLTNCFVKNYPILAKEFELEAEMTIHALDKGYNIKEISINYQDRPTGSLSKLKTLKDGLNIIKLIFNIFRYYRPLIFFNILALIFLALSIIFGSIVISEWIQTRYITHIPFAILATGLGIISIILVSLSFIMDAIYHNEKLNYERSLMLYKRTVKKFNV